MRSVPGHSITLVPEPRATQLGSRPCVVPRPAGKGVWPSWSRTFENSIPVLVGILQYKTSWHNCPPLTRRTPHRTPPTPTPPPPPPLPTPPPTPPLSNERVIRRVLSRSADAYLACNRGLRLPLTSRGMTRRTAHRESRDLRPRTKRRFFTPPHPPPWMDGVIVWVRAHNHAHNTPIVVRSLVLVAPPTSCRAPLESTRL